MSENSVSTPVSGDQAALMRRYVGALYALAEGDKAVDAVAADLRGLRRLWDESPEWRLVACDPRLSQDVIIKAAADVVKMAGLSTLTANFIGVMAENRRLAELPVVIQGFMAEMAARRGEHHAEIRTARPLSAAQRDALLASLNAATGGKVNMTVTEDAGILGGLTVKLGSQFIDASVKTRLDLLERTLKGAA